MTAAEVLWPVVQPFRPLPFDVELWDGSRLCGMDPRATLHVRSAKALGRLVRAPGELALARAWVRGEIDVSGDLETGLRLLYEGREEAGAGSFWGLVRAAVRLRVPVVGLPVPECEHRPRGRLHSLGRDRRAVAHHYDAPAEFYELLLGASMTYSCGYFSRPSKPLYVAQIQKVDRVLAKLDVKPGERLLDIGCGWGTLVERARRRGILAHGVTSSLGQASRAWETLGGAVQCQDYRAVNDGPYEAIASVGMVEHVGPGQLGVFMRKVGGLLVPGGRALVHGITKERPGRRSRFITRYVFPDAELSSLPEIVAAANGAGLEVRDVECIREHYPPTLRAWVANLEAHRERVVELVGVERFRVWRLYMVASALAFERGDLSVHQVLLERPGGSLAPRVRSL